MADPIDPKLLDKRVSQRYLRKGVLDEKDYAQHQKQLEDLSDRAVEIEASIDGDDLDDDLDDVDDDEAEDGQANP
jgi:hypothetical protein